jgi:hypothetical protein
MDELELELNGVQVPWGTYAGLQRNAAVPKDFTQVVPKPIVVVVDIKGQPAHALLDLGLSGDFISMTLADQLKLLCVELTWPLSLQLAVQGSRSKVNWGTKVNLKYQGINEECYLDIANLSSYDLILSTPWWFQHKVSVGMNPACVVIGSDKALPIGGEGVAKISSWAMSAYHDELKKVCQELYEYALPICKEVNKTELPPLWAINHWIPLIKLEKAYPWRPSCCPEAFQPQWIEKHDAYLRSGRWRVTSATNTVPMLLILKPGEVPELHTVIDLHTCNAKTVKMALPLPAIEEVLCAVARATFKSLLDQKNAYKQCCIQPSDVHLTTVATPDGNMVSEVIQIGDCNAPATFQALMNHIFSLYIGHFLYVYLDDIVIFLNTLEEHIEHVKLVIDILGCEKFYLGHKKLHFLQEELKILGHIVDKDGICMDPDKVDSVLNWKVPTSWDLLCGFLGSVGYLADDLASVCIPMAVLHGLMGDMVPLWWEYLHQHTFEDVKELISRGCGHCCVPLKYGLDEQPVFFVTDDSATGIAGAVLQGPDWKTGKVAAFFSAKLNSAEKDYPVHEIEMLAGVEAMIHHWDILQGVHFIWITDHKGLIHLVNQKNLLGCQACWIEKIGQFDFEVVYVPGVENMLADLLSQIYSNDAAGTVWALSEYTYHNVVNEDLRIDRSITMLVLAGVEAVAVSCCPWTKKLVSPAKMGCPETSKEFAACVKDSFMLKGPQQPQEGMSVAKGLTIKLPAQTPDGKMAKPAPGPPDNPAPVPVTDLSEKDTSLVGVVSDDGSDLPAVLKNNYLEDSFYKAILDKPKHYCNFEVVDGLIFVKVKDHWLLCIPQVYIQGCKVREIVIAEAHSLLAHLGASKTLSYLCDHVW